MRRSKVVAVAIAAVVSVAGLAVAEPAQAAYSNNCWAFVGGDRSTGGCKGAAGGTTFRVAEVCQGNLGQVIRYSPYTYAAANVAVNAQTSACGWGFGSARYAYISDNY
jgi:hypothetical protein